MEKQLELLREIIETYFKYGWTLQRVLLTPETINAQRRRASGDIENSDERIDVKIEGVTAREFETDALWFSRVAAGGREAWELRLVSTVAYALFELFEADEADEDREDVRREMEARLREQFGRKENQPQIEADTGG